MTKHLGSNGSSYEEIEYISAENTCVEGVRAQLHQPHGGLQPGETGTIVGANPLSGDPIVNFDDREHSAVVPFSKLGPA